MLEEIEKHHRFSNKTDALRWFIRREYNEIVSQNETIIKQRERIEELEKRLEQLNSKMP